MSAKENDVATAKQERYQKFGEYVDNHPNEIYIDYQDKLGDEQIDLVLDGKSDEVRMKIEDNFISFMESDDYYWRDMAEELGVEIDEIEEWRDDEGYWPGTYLTDSDWNRIVGNTSVYITATVDSAEWKFDSWSYGQPVSYSDVKESLKILGVNPLEFKNIKTGGGMTSGEGTLKGWFPDMPNREPKVNPQELWDNTCVLYDGVMNFCLGDLEDLMDVMSSDSKYITFNKGTNVVMYNFGGGAGITDTQLTGSVTIRRDMVQFGNDESLRYGIQSCYGFVHSYWYEGSVRNGK